MNDEPLPGWYERLLDGRAAWEEIPPPASDEALEWDCNCPTPKDDGFEHVMSDCPLHGLDHWELDDAEAAVTGRNTP